MSDTLLACFRVSTFWYHFVSFAYDHVIVIIGALYSLHYTILRHNGVWAGLVCLWHLNVHSILRHLGVLRNWLEIVCAPQ